MLVKITTKSKNTRSTSMINTEKIVSIDTATTDITEPMVKIIMDNGMTYLVEGELEKVSSLLSRRTILKG